jgi:hypothetical protein
MKNEKKNVLKMKVQRVKIATGIKAGGGHNCGGFQSCSGVQQ